VFHVSVRHRGKLFFARRFGPFEDGNDGTTHAGRSYDDGHWLQLSAEAAQPEGVVTLTAEESDYIPHDFSVHVVAERRRDGALATLMDRILQTDWIVHRQDGPWGDSWAQALEHGGQTGDVLTFVSQTDLHGGRNRNDNDYFQVHVHLFVQAQDAADGAVDDAAPLYYKNYENWRSRTKTDCENARKRPIVLRRTGGAAVLSFDRQRSFPYNAMGCEELCCALDLLH
jgi:hypothetical protein